LELDDGTALAESMAIIRYLEELHPQPPLLGATALERAEIEMWLRRLEQRLYIPVDWGPPLGRMIPGAEVPFREGARRFLKRLDTRLAEHEFVACDRFSMADIFGFGALDYGRRFAGFPLPADAPHLRRWFEASAARPSAQA
jgi:glutathione S-transferase